MSVRSSECFPYVRWHASLCCVKKCFLGVPGVAQMIHFNHKSFCKAQEMTKCFCPRKTDKTDLIEATYWKILGHGNGLLVVQVCKVSTCFLLFTFY